jgi:hypothetical protein
VEGKGEWSSNWEEGKKKGDLILLKGKMNGIIILKERILEWSPEFGRRKRVMEFLVWSLRVIV